MTNICNICRTEGRYFLKICQCTESRICPECLTELNNHSHRLCPLCRRELNTETLFRKKEYINILGQYLLHLCLIVLFECIIPVIYFLSDSPNDSLNDKSGNIGVMWFSKDKVIIAFIFFAVFLIQPLNIILWGYINNIPVQNCIGHNLLLKNVLLANIVIESILFLLATEYVAWFYMIFILIPLYYIVFIFHIIIMISIYARMNLTRVRRRVSITRIVPLNTDTDGVDE